MDARYPKATWLGNGKSGGSFIGKPWRVVLHTTETTSVPGYNSGSYAPHLTYEPKNHQWYQHTSLETAARALRNESGGVQTNRANSIQVEIVCYSAKNIADQKDSRLWVANLDGQALADIREFLEWAPVEFEWRGQQAHSYSEANAPGYRFTNDEWNAFNGVCSHQDLPENSHWDAGALDWPRLMGSEPIEQAGRPYMYPIKRGDGADDQRPERKMDIQYFQAKMNDLGIDAGDDGLADQDFLDKFFVVVGSPVGGSYIDGNEGATFERIYISNFADPGPKGDKGDAGKQGIKGDKGDTGDYVVRVDGHIVQ